MFDIFMEQHKTISKPPTNLYVRDTPVYLVGDLHTNYKEFSTTLTEMDLHDCILIFLGDMAFKNKENAIQQFRKLDRELFKRRIRSFIIRGNHDNPNLWKDESFWMEFNSFKPFDTTTRLDLNGNIGIIIDGAVTLNRDLLTDGVNYWSETDKPSLPHDIEDFGENLKNIDFVVGHGGPVLDDFFKGGTGCEKFLKDGFLVEDLANEQKIYRQILRRYRPKRWYCGHYHMDKHCKFVWDNWSDDGTIDLRIIDKQKIQRIT